MQFGVQRWQEAISWAHRASACANHREQYQKLLTRWYYTPHRIAKAYLSASPLCWRMCGGRGTLLHVFWSCPLLRQFWDMVLSLISDLVGKPCPRRPEFAMLLVGIDAIASSHRIVTCNVLHAARLAIARHWKSTDIPSTIELNTIISNVCLHERTLAWHRGTHKKFERHWSSWLALVPNLT